MPPQFKHLSEQTSKRLYTLGEEIAHSITHGIGTGLSIAGLTLLVVLAVLSKNVAQIVSQHGICCRFIVITVDPS